ncbi:hypothetical protein HHI36_000586, partial [Cryptolaemus montrouzieri]
EWSRQRRYRWCWCKRTADAIVATGGDIDSLETFADAIQRRYPGIILLTINAEAINKMISDIQKQNLTSNDSIEKDDIAKNTPKNKSNNESENMAGQSSIQQYNVGGYILVKFPVRKMEYRYAAIINQIDKEEGEITVTFMKICNNRVHTFKIDEKNVSDVSFEQIVKKLPNPDLILKGKRRFFLM